MDTATHIVSGIAIGAIATQLVNLPMENVIYLSAITASILPDFDVLFKLHNNNKYVLTHRGFSHSIISLPILALLSSLLGFIFFRHFGILFLVSIVGVFFHLLLDILNPYGTTVIPKKHELKLSVIYTFDPIFFSILLSCLILSYLFIYMLLVGFLLLLIYLFVRLFIQHKITNKLKQDFKDGINYYVLSKINPNKWHIIIEKEKNYLVGTYQKGKLDDIDTLYKASLPKEKQDLLEKNKTYKAFKKKSYAFIILENQNQIQLIDLKYRKKGFYYFRACFIIEENKIQNSYLGWLFSEEKFQKRLSKEGTK